MCSNSETTNIRRETRKDTYPKWERLFASFQVHSEAIGQRYQEQRRNCGIREQVTEIRVRGQSGQPYRRTTKEPEGEPSPKFHSLALCVEQKLNKYPG